MKIPAFIKSLCKLCDTESSRYALGGVKCEAGLHASAMTATDGKLLASVSFPDQNEDAFDLIVAGKDMARAYAAHVSRIGGDDTCVVLEPRGKEVTIAGGKGSTLVAPIDGRFPNYRQVLPTGGAGPADKHSPDLHDGYVSVMLDPAMLGKLCDLYVEAAGRKPAAGLKGMTLWVKDSESAVYLSAAYHPDGTEYVIRAAIMPLAADGPGKAAVYPTAYDKPATDPTATIRAVRAAKGQKRTPAPTPEHLSDDAIAEAVTREPDAVGDLPAVTGAAL